MIDFESYFRYGPALARIGELGPADIDDCGCYTCRQNLPLQEKLRTRVELVANQKGDWLDEQYMLCPPRVLGYILRDKQWAQLEVSSLKTNPKNDIRNPWSERLKLADGGETKQIILDLVSSQVKGLITLLYGESNKLLPR